MIDATSDASSVRLLWTGGWDSTFQLLQLLLVQGRRVAPHYLIDAERMSTGVEIRAMQRIKERIFGTHPDARELMQPTCYFAAADLPADDEIAQAFQAIRQQQYMGNQYEWLARFCKREAIDDMQLCIHRDDRAHEVIGAMVARGGDGAATTCRIDDHFAGTPEHAIFRHFSLPVFDLSKEEMAATASRLGWGEFMAMTWFCHSPRRGRLPCGKCNPCRYTREEGFGWRIPLSSRVLSFVELGLLDPAKAILKASRPRRRTPARDSDAGDAPT